MLSWRHQDYASAVGLVRPRAAKLSIESLRDPLYIQLAWTETLTHNLSKDRQRRLDGSAPMRRGHSRPRILPELGVVVYNDGAAAIHRSPFGL